MAEKSPDDAEAKEYYLEVESHFAKRRGTPFLFSPKDWALMVSWYEGGIPLPVVIEAIDRCFDRRDQEPRRRQISGLSFCKYEVRKIWQDRKDLLVGASGEVPEENTAGSIDRLRADLERRGAETDAGAVRDRIAGAAREVGALRPSDSTPALEQALVEIEQRLIDDLCALLPPEERRAIEAEIDQTLGGQVIEPEILRRTREANLKRLVRGRFSLPRLSLFA